MIFFNINESVFTVKSLFVAAATIKIGNFLAQNLLSKIWVLLRLLFKGGYYLRAATNKDFTVGQRNWEPSKALSSSTELNLPWTKLSWTKSFIFSLLIPKMSTKALRLLSSCTTCEQGNVKNFGSWISPIGPRTLLRINFWTG